MMRNVYLQGELGEKFGEKFTMEASSIVDVMKCLEANRPEFKQFLIECIDKNVDINISACNKDISKEDLFIPLEKGDITLYMVPSGSKKALKIVLAIVIAVFAPQTLFFQSLALNLALQGIAELTASDPSTDKKDEEGATDYLFSGSQKASKKNDPVPVLYGELRVPGRVADFSVETGLRINPSVVVDGHGNISSTVNYKDYTVAGE